MLHKMFHALADVWRVFIFSAAEYQTAVAAVIFSANGVRQIPKNHLHYAVGMRYDTCYFVALVLSHWPILASGFFQVIFTVVYTAVFSAVNRVLMQTNSILSPSSGIIFSIIHYTDTYLSR